MSYTYPTPRKQKAPKLPKTLPSDVRGVEPAEEMGLILGQQPGSIQEWWIAKALDKLHLRYHYQFRVFGGRAIRGGQVIDFLVLMAPSAVPLQYYGGYWHRDELKNMERLAIYQLQAEFGRVVILTDVDGESEESIYAAVRRELNV